MTSEIEILTNSVEEVTLVGGMKLNVNRLKTRSTFKLLKIITSGASYALNAFDSDSTPEEFASGLSYAILLAIPEAEEETIDFIKSMVSPAGLNLTSKAKDAKSKNSELVAEFQAVLDDPELEDLITIISAIVQNEAPHIQALGKRLSSMWMTVQKDRS